LSKPEVPICNYHTKRASLSHHTGIVYYDG
jgi:hypothetical protein